MSKRITEKSQSKAVGWWEDGGAVVGCKIFFQVKQKWDPRWGYSLALATKGDLTSRVWCSVQNFGSGSKLSKKDSQIWTLERLSHFSYSLWPPTLEGLRKLWIFRGSINIYFWKWKIDIFINTSRKLWSKMLRLSVIWLILLFLHVLVSSSRLTYGMDLI